MAASETGVAVELMRSTPLVTDEVLSLTNEGPGIPLMTDKVRPVAAARVVRAYTRVQPAVKGVARPGSSGQEREAHGERDGEGAGKPFH